VRGPAGDTPKGRAARTRIVDAAWELLVHDGSIPLTAGLSVRSVAAAAGMSPGAVQHHFPTMTDLSDAMVDAVLVGVSVEPVEAAGLGMERVDESGFAEAVRAGAQANWEVLSSADESEVERRLRRLYALAVGRGDDAESMRARLGEELWGSYRPTVESMMGALVEAAGRRPVDPFTVGDLAQLTGALAEGLLAESMCGGVPVRAGLYADSVVALALALTVPARRRWTLADIDAGLHEPAGTALERVDVAVDVACAAAGLFSEGYADVGLAAVAAAAGADVSVESIVDAFGTSRSVAAVSFARHLDAVAVAAVRRRDTSVEVALSDVVTELARRAQAEPWVAAALVHERVLARASDPDRLVGLDVRRAVPLDDLIGDLLAELRPGWERREVDATAALVVDTVLNQSAGRSEEALGALVARVLRLVPSD